LRILNITIFYFSGTGNTWWVSNKIKEQLEQRGHSVKLISIEKENIDWENFIKNTLDECDAIGIGHPVYSSDIPEIMQKWIKEILCPLSSKFKKVKSKELRAFVFDTMAYFSGDTPLITKKLLKKCGFKVRQAINIRMLGNISLIPMLMVWDEKKKEKIFHKAEKKISKLVDKVIEDKKWLMRRDPFSRLIGWTQRVGFKLTKNSFRKHFIIDRERCKLCGLCINFCPVKNLKLEKSEDKEMITYGSDCIFCLRCFNNCPQNAILFYEKTKDTKKYRRFRDQIPNFKLKYVKN